MSIDDENGWTAKSRELAQLLARAGLGDRAAFARLYERTSGHLFAVVLRKGYGLGAMAMTGGGFHVPVATIAWYAVPFALVMVGVSAVIGFFPSISLFALQR